MADGLDGFSDGTLVAAPRPDEAPDAERAAIACVLCDVGGTHRAIDRMGLALAPDDFADPRRAAIWRAMLAVQARGEYVDAAAVVEVLTAKRETLAVKHMGELVALDVSPAACEQHARAVAEHAYQRAVAVALRKALDVARGAGRPLDTVAAALAVVAAMPAGVRGQRDDSLRAGCLEALDEIEAAMQSAKAGEAVAATWGLISLDGGMTSGGWYEGALGGLFAGKLYLLCGVPAAGKTTLAWQAVLATARTGRKVLVFSLEMTREDLCKRIAGQMAGIPEARMERGAISGDEFDAIGTALQDLGRLPVDVITDCRTLELVRARVLAERARGSVALVVIDFLQLLNMTEHYDDGNRADEARVYGVKAIANDAKVAVIAVSSMTKTAQRAAKTGEVDNTGAKGAGAEFAADVIAFLVRVDPEDNGGCPEVRFHMTKRRGGPLASPFLRFDMARGQFRPGRDNEGFES